MQAVAQKPEATLVGLAVSAKRATLKSGKFIELYVSGGANPELEVRARASAPAQQDPRATRALCDLIVKELKASGQLVWTHLSDAKLATWAGCILQSALEKRTVATADELAQVMNWTKEVLRVGDDSRTRDDACQFRFHRLRELAVVDLSAAGHANGNTAEKTWGDLSSIHPANDCTKLLEADVLNANSVTAKLDPNSPEVQPWAALQQLVAACEAGHLSLPGAQSAAKVMAGNVVVQHAFLEYWCSRLETDEGVVPQRVDADELKAVAHLLATSTGQSPFQSVFLTRATLARLEAQVENLKGDARKQFRSKLKILARNSQRYETYRQSPIGRVPEHEQVSRDFMLQMFDRLNGCFDPERVPDRKELMAYARRPRPSDAMMQVAASAFLGKPSTSVEPRNAPSLIDARQAGAGLQSVAWELQNLLCTLTDDSAADQQGDWAKAARLLFRMIPAHVDPIFAYQETIAAFERYLRRETAHSPIRDQLLGTLQANAMRMEAFMDSDISRNANFDDVDRAALIPWWEIMKDALPRAPGESEADAGVEVEFTAEHLDASATVAIHVTPQAPVETAVPSPTVLSKPTEAAARPVNVIRPARPSAKAAEPESKRPPPLARESLLPVFTRPAQRRSSTNPWRTDGVAPTGRERRRFDNAAEHHVRSRAKWLGKQERTTLSQQANERLVMTHAPRAGQAMETKT